MTISASWDLLYEVKQSVYLDEPGGVGNLSFILAAKGHP